MFFSNIYGPSFLSVHRNQFWVFSWCTELLNYYFVRCLISFTYSEHWMRIQQISNKYIVSTYFVPGPVPDPEK